jgi:DNA-binding MarR family transcriptional regulator
MLTIDTVVALLQGLPPTYTNSLPEPWESIARRISAAASNHATPEAALRFVLNSLFAWELQVLRESIANSISISQIPGLTRSQRQALLAVRGSTILSQSNLCDILAKDRSQVNRRMAGLVRKGLVVKVFHKGAAHYFAPATPNDRQLRRRVHRLLANLANELPAEPAPYLPQLVALAQPATSATSDTFDTDDTPDTIDTHDAVDTIDTPPHTAVTPKPRSLAHLVAPRGSNLQQRAPP